MRLLSSFVSEQRFGQRHVCSNRRDYLVREKGTPEGAVERGGERSKAQWLVDEHLCVAHFRDIL